MRLLWTKIYRTWIGVIALTIMLFILGEIAYSGPIDEFERRASNGSRTLAPGWLNIDRQRSEEIINQAWPKKKSFLERAVEYVKNKFKNRMAETTTDKVTPDLKKKISVAEGTRGDTKAQTLILGGEGNLLAGDLNKDGKVDFLDLGLFSSAWGTGEGDEHYNKYADLNGDGKVNGGDLAGFSGNFGRDDTDPDALRLKDILGTDEASSSSRDTYLEYIEKNERTTFFEDSDFKYKEGKGHLHASLSPPVGTLGESSIETSLAGDIMEEKDVMGSLRSSLSKENALSVINKFGLDERIDTESVLADSLESPDSIQKQILEAMTTLLAKLNEIEKAVGEEVASEELEKAKDELMQMTAAVIVAQALPGLFNGEDISSIKNIFGELNGVVNSIVLKHEAAMDAYYEEVKKDLANNLSILQLTNILSKKITEKEFDELPRHQIDEIIKKITELKDKSFAEEYILQQEAKYRKDFKEQTKNLLERDMSVVLDGFSKKLFTVLDGASGSKN